MKRILLGAVLIGSITVAAPPALADGHIIHGGCFMLAFSASPILDNPPDSGLIGDVSATTDFSAIPIPATVFCKLEVNGVNIDVPTSFSGPGVQAGVAETGFAAYDGDRVDLCQRVLYGDGTDTGYSCRAVTIVDTQPVIDPVASVFQQFIDPNVCPILKAQAGTYAGGALVINADGDVTLPFVFWGVVYDCPPYGDFTEGIPINTSQAFHVNVYFALPPLG